MESGGNEAFVKESSKLFDLDQFLKKDVDLSKYFSKTEMAEMGHCKTQRFKNIVQNFEVMLYMGLPAIKPDFMKGPAYRSRVANSRQRAVIEAEEAAKATKSDSDEEWTPDMEKKKREKEMKLYPVPRYEKPKQTKRKKSNKESHAKKHKSSPVVEETMRVYNLREKTQSTNYMVHDVPDDDQFIFCELCEKEYDMDCPVHGALLFVPDTKVEIPNDPDFALHTLPAGLVVTESPIPGAGLGVISQIEIPARTMYGSYGGVIETDSETAHKSGYAWQIYKNGTPSHFIDARDKTDSNWMRYVNCARHEEQQNLVAFQYKGQIYYRTYKEIRPGTELLTYYGAEYARDLGIVHDKNMLLRPHYVNGEEYFPCVFCKTAFTTAVYCVRHLITQHGRDKLNPSDIQTLDAWLRENNYKRSNYHNVGLTKPQNSHAQNKLLDEKTKNINSNHIQNKDCKNIEFEQKVEKSRGNQRSGITYSCSICGSTFANNSHLVSHMRIHSGEKPFKCDVCEYACSHKHYFVNHMRIHSGEKPFKCDVCGYSSSDSRNLFKHIRTHSGEKPFKCDVCVYACSHKHHLVRHMKTHSGEKPFKCDVCGYACSIKPDLVAHMRTHSGEKPFKCDKCGYACSVSSNLVTHMRTHSGEKPFKCNVCGYACRQNNNLVRHMRIHSGEKPFKCDVCGYAFSLKQHLVGHMRKHSGEKPFKCDVCGYAFSQKQLLVRHMRIHSGEKPFKCDVCGYAFNQKQLLVRHMRIHSGEKPFKCDVCGHACSQSQDMTTHKRTHSREKPLKCDVCGYAFSSKSTLVKHMRTHSEEKPFKCDM